MDRLLVISLLFICSCTWLRAQNGTTVTMPLAECNNMQNQIDSLNSFICQMTSVNDSLSVSLVARDSIITNLRIDLTTAKDQLSKERMKLRTLTDSIRILNARIAGLNEKVASLDMVRLRYANGRLQLSYNKEKINEAIELFNAITNESLKEQYKEVLFWLKKYGSYLPSIRELLNTLQNDQRNNKFQIDEWKVDALTKLNANAYMRESQGHYFTIYYLDKILSTAKSRIEQAKSKVDFSDLLEQL